MHTQLTSRRVDQAIAAIQALDLEPIRLRVMDAELGEGWTREYAENVEGAYRNYLTMLVRHPEDIEDIAVSKDVDEFWHTHILHTMKYTEDCERVFGKYLHHNPHIGDRTRTDIEKKAAQAEATRRLYQQEFQVVQDRKAGWSGVSQEVENAAFCGAGVRADDAAFCGASIRAGGAAFCGASVKPENTAFCGASVQANDAAFCGASIVEETGPRGQPAVVSSRTSFNYMVKSA